MPEINKNEHFPIIFLSVREVLNRTGADPRGLKVPWARGVLKPSETLWDTGEKEKMPDWLNKNQAEN